MNCVVYARVSTDKQAEKELSIPAQLQAMRDCARQRGWIVVAEFVERGASAKTTERPALQELLAQIRAAEAAIDIVLVHKIDRLARSVYDHATIKALLKQRGIRLASVVENVDESVSGQLVENIMASIAQFYSSNLADEVRKGMRQKVLTGGWPHLAPRGYVPVRTSGGAAQPHPKDGPLVQKAYELYATGWYSLKALATLLARDGLTGRTGRPLAHQYLRRMLSNPFYIGRLRWKDLDVAGSHEALVTESLFAQVQDVMRRRFKDPGAKGSVAGFPLRGLAICASCRGHMTAGWQRKRWGYYRCSRRGYNKVLCAATKYCRTTVAHRDIEGVCDRLRLSQGTAAAIRDAASRLIAARTADAQQRLNAVRQERTHVAERELKLTEAFLAGTIAPGAYKAMGEKLRKDRTVLERELSALQCNPTELMNRVDTTLSLATTVWELHDQLSESRRIELLRTVFKTVVLDSTGLAGFTLRPPFDAIFKNSHDGTPKPLAAVPPQPQDTAALAEEMVRNAGLPIENESAVITAA